MPPGDAGQGPSPDENTIYCRECGQQNLREANFCQRCGGERVHSSTGGGEVSSRSETRGDRDPKTGGRQQSEESVAVDRSKLASRADTVSLVAFLFPVLSVAVFYYGLKLRNRNNPFARRIIGRAIGALVWGLFAAWVVTM
jgi:uncharacterized membrane protein YvbJ